MTLLKPDTPIDWAGIQHGYETGGETLKQLCARFGVTKGALEYRAKKERWVSRRSRLGDRQSSTLARLFAVLETQVTKLANASGDTLGDKEAQQLTELIKNFDKIATIANIESKAEAPPQKRDMRDLRDKLAKRIDQFNRR